MISLLHPSRNRPEKAYSTYKNWMDKASGEIEIEHILSTDLNDNSVAAYLPYFKDSMVLINPNDCVVQATNYAAKESKGKVLIYLSDDFDCPNDWDKLVYNILGEAVTPKLLKVDDCLQPFHQRVVTIPMMNRLLYDKLGYFWHPEYRSMFVDQDLFETTKKNGWITYAPGLVFPHNHWLNKKAEVDETYKRSESNWEQGKQVFTKRQLNGFSI